MKPLPARLKSLLLRGPLLRAWYDRKVDRVERVYLDEVRRVSGESKPEPGPVRLQVGEPLRRLLCIWDNMWEENSLLPEVRRIAETRALDLGPHFRHAPPSAWPVLAARAVRDFIATQSGWEPDAILLYARSSLLSEELFSTLRERWKCPLFGMQLDDKFNFLEHGILPSERCDGYVHWARHFDLNITNCLVVSDWYRLRGLPTVYMAPGFLREDLPTPEPSASYRYEMSFLGSVKPDRQLIIDRLLSEGVPIALFGKGWPDSRWVDRPARVYRESQLNLGIGFATPHLTTIKARDFECPGAGGCYLTTYNWELAHWFELGREILLYRCVEELLEMFSYYRRRPAACAQIALAGHRRCVAEHTWEKRFRKLFAESGFRS